MKSSLVMIQAILDGRTLTKIYFTFMYTSKSDNVAYACFSSTNVLDQRLASEKFFGNLAREPAAVTYVTTGGVAALH